jgi:peptidoglycan/LPS O-acetylase OafA/YrhL
MNSITPTQSVGRLNTSAKKTDRNLPCLTGARFVAALLVVLYHFGDIRPLPGTLFCYGNQAVSFFFILSGVVLTYAYRDAINSGAVGWSKFFNLRLSRILPVHVATWFIATGLYVWFAWDPYQGRHPIFNWILGLACLQVYWPAADVFRWNAQAWSISCELFFYALFPFLLPLLTRHLRSRGSAIATMVGIYLLQVTLYLGACLILHQLISPGHSFLGYQTFSQTLSGALKVFPVLRLGEFVIGICLGLLILRPEPLLRSPLRANLLLGFCAVVLFELARLPTVNPLMRGFSMYNLFVPILALTLVPLMSGLTIVTPLLENRFAILLGEASYSLYLVHLFFLPGVHPTKLKYFLCLAGSIISAIMLYWFVERPARRVWRRVLSGRRDTSAKPVAYPGPVPDHLGVREEPLRPGMTVADG